MGFENKHSGRSGRRRALACGTALTALFAFLPGAFPAYGQDMSALTGDNKGSILLKEEAGSHAPMLLSADEIIYDRNGSSITAQGHVQIEYDGNKIVARRIVYNQQTKRVMAYGNVEIIDTHGIKIYAEQIDLTDDLGEGFVNGLRAETPDNTRFAAESAERSAGQMTVFNNGIYTACEPCYAKPAKNVFWQVKAKKIIWNGATKTMRFEDSQFEVFGKPVAWFPVFEMADSTVKRKSGFLTPGVSYKTKLGLGVTASYFWNLAPNYDFTLSETGFTKQGFLTEGVWRHRLQNGSYDMRFAYIRQEERDAFKRDTIDSRQTSRYMGATKGNFIINPRWSYGWDILAQSDHNFSRTYDLDGYNKGVHRSQIYLQGLNKRNYFDMRFYHFEVQDDTRKWRSDGSRNPDERYSKQPWVLPRIDYSYIPQTSVLGGELQFNSNLQTIYRDKSDYGQTDWSGNHNIKNARLVGMSGTSARLTGEMEWKRSFISDYGFVFSPIMALRGDGITIDQNRHYQDVNLRDDTFRGLATAGLEMRYPFLMATPNTSHIIEPVAQIFVRNNEQYTGRLVNEDAQSFVFDATTLFSRDKFSGYDRVEGGTRANLGVRYSGDIANGWSVYSLAGQSYQLGGRNSFASHDLTGVTADSGLEHARSDYVGMLGVNDGGGLFVAARGRFDRDDFTIRRGEVEAQKQWQPLTLGVRYAYIQKQPDYGYAKDREETSVNGTYKLNANWSVNGQTTYDIVSDTWVRAGGGLGYQNECFGMMFGYLQTRNPGKSAVSNKWHFLLSFRTLGDIGNGKTVWK